MRNHLAIAIALLLPNLAIAEPAQTCRDGTNAKALDFWIGDWRVTDAKDGSFQGKDRVERVLDGCAVIENWTGADANDQGKSLFSYDARAHRWDQVWVTLNTAQPGGLKHKTLIAITPEGGTRFQGNLDLPDGRVVMDRTTLTPMPDRRVHQVIEISKDGGTTWIANFDALYALK
ncbi:MAG: hypothetical protein ACTHPD_02715 [Rhizomicrobium sp.]